MIKSIILVVLLSSCSVLDNVKDTVTGAYDVGRFKGRMEVLDELRRNKEQIDILKKNLVGKLMDMQSQDDREVTALVPELLGLVQLISNRKDLKDHLKTVDETSSGSADKD